MSDPASNAPCPKCHAPLPADAPQSLCLHCMLALGAEREESEARSQEAEVRSQETEVGRQESGVGGQETEGRGEAFAVRGFGDFELIEELGRGGMGVVFKARQKSLGRIVALKTLRVGEDMDKDVAQRLRAEAAAAASLHHPHIVAIHEVGAHEGQPYFAMQFIEGHNLARVNAACEARDAAWIRRAARWVRTVAAAIHHAHEHGILHRDLKPSNILIDALDEPRITDFGLAKRLLHESDLTLSGQVLGSPNYMPPEQAMAQRGKVGRRSDVYSLGAILYHLLTGRPPCMGQTVAETLQEVLTREPIAPRLLNPAVPRDLETLCLKCLEKEPDRRYPTAELLAQELDRFLGDEPIQARPVGRVEKAWRWCRRKPALAAAFAALFVVMVGGVSGIVWQWRRAERSAIEESRQRAKAEESQKLAESQAAKSREVARMLKEMLAGINPASLQGRDSMATMREMLRQAENRVGHELGNHPDVEAEICDTIGLSYSDLRAWGQAESMFRRALRLRLYLHGEQHRETLNTTFNLIGTLWHQRDIPPKGQECQQLLEKTFDLHIKANGSNNVRTAELLGYFARTAKGHREGEVFNRLGLAILNRIGATNEIEYGQTLRSIGHHLFYQDRYEEALGFGREAVAAQQRAFGELHPTTADALYELAIQLRGVLQLAEAEVVARKAWEAHRQLHGPTNEATLNVMWLVATTAYERGDLAGAGAALATAPFELVDSHWRGRSVAGEEMRYWLVRTLTRLSSYWQERSSLDRARQCARHAEILGRQLVQLRLSRSKSLWRLANARGALGEALVAAASCIDGAGDRPPPSILVEAESLLTDSYRELKTSVEIPPAHRLLFRREALERLVRLYTSWERVAPASEHAAQLASRKAELAGFEQQ